jgi:hypothetical protein
MASAWHDDGSAMGNIGNIFVNVYRRQGSVDRMNQACIWLRNMIREYPQGLGQMIVLEASSFEHTLSSETRAMAATMAKEFAPHTRALAYVIEGEGFRVAAVRMALSGFRLVSRADHPERVFRGPEEGAQWLSEQMSGINPQKVLSLVEELRALIPND